LLARQLARDLRAELTLSSGAEAEGLVLELGSVDAELPDPATPGDAAPFSVAGIAKFGVWLPEPEPDPELARPVARATASVVGTAGAGTPTLAGTPAPGATRVGTPVATTRAGAAGTPAPGPAAATAASARTVTPARATAPP